MSHEAIRPWPVITIFAAAMLIAACAGTAPQTSAQANVDPYAIDPPRPYPTPSLPSTIVGLTARADTGDSHAQCVLGIDYEEGHRILANYSRARDLFTQSAAQHDGCGITNLGNLYFNGEGVPQSFATARMYYEAAVQVRYAPAYYNLGEVYKYGDGVPVDERIATEWLEKAATAKYTLAYTELGDLYAFGHYGKYHNGSLAVHYYRLAIATHGGDRCGCALEHRNRAAQNLAFLYLNIYKGTNSLRYRMVLDLLRRTPNDAWTQDQIAWMYARGYGVKKDSDIASTWYKKSADQGDASAATSYAAYLFGETRRPVQRVAALAYLREAVLGGDANGMNELADVKLNGKYLPRDIKGGIALLTQASASGSLGAIIELANLYYNGVFVPRDRYKAYILFHVAADLGATMGPGLEKTIRKGLTQQQLEAAGFEIKALDQTALRARDQQTDLPAMPPSSKVMT